jgi:hypothetical protein
MAIAKETRSVQDFEEVVMEGHGELLLTQGDTEALEIEADADLLPKIKSEVKDGRLALGMQHWWDHLLPPWGPIIYRLTMKTIRGVGISGSGTVTAGDIQTDHCRLNLSGSGRGTLARLAAESAEFRISGSGRIEVAGGEAARQEITISGSGHLDAANLACADARVHISGSGNVALQASKTLDVHISGSGDVRYRGQPAVSQHVSGSGRIRQMEA